MYQSKSLRFLKNVQSKRAITIILQMPDTARETIFFYKKMHRLGVRQPFFYIRHCDKHDSTAFYQINIEC